MKLVLKKSLLDNKKDNHIENIEFNDICDYCNKNIIDCVYYFPCCCINLEFCSLKCMEKDDDIEKIWNYRYTDCDYYCKHCIKECLFDCDYGSYCGEGGSCLETGYLDEEFSKCITCKNVMCNTHGYITNKKFECYECKIKII